MFGICIYAWLLPSPAKHNLYPFKETGLSMYVATCLLPEKNRFLGKINTWFVSKMIVGVMCQDKR